MKIDQGKLPPPPGLIASLTAGFDTAANHISLAILPVLLDLFIWLGPHLHLQQFLQPFTNNINQLPLNLGGQNLPDANTIQQFWKEIAEQLNYFIALRTYPVGISSLMSGRNPIESPLGSPLIMDAGSWTSVIGWGVLILLVGWILGSMYYYWVSTVSLKLEGQRSMFRSIAQTVLLSMTWTLLLAALGLPILLLFSILFLISPILAEVAFFVLALLSLWLVMPIFFSPHGIYTYQQNAFHAIQNSLRMVRLTMPTSGLFIVMFVLISQGLDFLWRTPSENSWLALIGIAGHAFISTALLAASFIYYRDINSWLKTVFDQLKNQATSIRA